MCPRHFEAAFEEYVMGAFTIDMTSPYEVGAFTTGYGGPNSGGHQGPNWYNQYGMDLGAAPGTAVYATFDAHITVYHPHVPANDHDKEYGAELFMRSPNDKMGGYYTHITDVPPEITVGSSVKLNDYLGKVYGFGDISPHLHLALVEIIGALVPQNYHGVDLYKFFLGVASTDAIIPVTFPQDGSPPHP
jgi:hypothetical protein